MILILLIIFSFAVFTQTKLEEGSEAPNFTLENGFGKEYTLSSFFGKSPVIIYFYPKAGTSGCTKQACAIRDDWTKFEENNIQVFGISTDSKEEIKTFIDEYNINFPLLSDEDRSVSEKYGVLNEKGTAKRVTFIIDKEGKIAEMITVKDIDSHSDYVFDAAIKLETVNE